MMGGENAGYIIVVVQLTNTANAIAYLNLNSEYQQL
jgi:hypothetical protein